MRRTRTLAAVAAALTLALPATAHAHVTLQPSQGVPAGGFTRLDVRVPNERDDASTTKVDVKLPDGFAFASYEPVAGWKVGVAKAKLATPIKTDDGEITEQVSRITWTAGSPAAAIPPGAFRDFGLSVQVPDRPGGALTFKALQTYSDGEVVRWIGAQGSPAPAPVVRLAAAGGAAPAPTATPASRPAASTGGGSDTLAIAALALGALGLLAGLAALAAARRARERIAA
jgi:uncharacterized protein YcnI